MTAQEIFDRLLSGSISILEPTCDKLIAGDPNKEVKRIGACFKLTAELIQKAVEQNVDMIITHEPTFSQGDKRKNAIHADLLKWKLLDESKLTVYRYHDHAHHREGDYIHAGFIKALELKIREKYPRESLGVCRYELEEPTTAKLLAEKIHQQLGIALIRIVGKEDHPVRTLGLGLGCVEAKQIGALFDPGCDLFIAGETGEVCDAELVRDACIFGENKALLLLGHYSSECWGMKLLAEDLNSTYGNAVFLEGREVYRGI